MIRRHRLKLLVLALLAASAWPAAASPLRDGEYFAFRVAWGIFRHAGEITITAQDELIEGEPRTRVTTETSSRGFIRALYSFDARVDSYFDPRTGQLLEARASTVGRKRTEVSITFDYATGTAHYVDHLRPERTTTLEIPPGLPMDLITSLINTRVWKLDAGDKRPIAVLFDDEFYELVVTAERVESIGTVRGREPALLLVPRMEGEPKGMFRRGGEIRVWLSEDEQRLPMRLEVAVKVGMATALLTEYRLPGSVPDTNDANPGPQRRRGR